MWGCSCLGDRGTERLLQRIVCTQGGRGLLPEYIGHQAHHRLVIVHLSTTDDRDAHRHLRGVTADRVIEGHCWLARYLSRQAFIGVYLPLQVTLGRWCECSQNRPCCLVDICLCHHRVVLGVLPVMKGGGVLDRNTCQTAQPIETERGDIAP